MTPSFQSARGARAIARVISTPTTSNSEEKQSWFKTHHNSRRAPQQAVAPAPVKVKSDPSVLAVKSKSTLRGERALLRRLDGASCWRFGSPLQKSFAHDLPTPAATFRGAQNAVGQSLLRQIRWHDGHHQFGLCLAGARVHRLWHWFSIIAIPLGRFDGFVPTPPNA